MVEGVRARARRVMRAELGRIALELFAAHGYAETTVDDIAVAAGISKRSFFRYFQSKEDAAFVDLDLMGEQVIADLRARPSGEPAWDGLHHVLRDWADRIHAADDGAGRLRLIETTAALRSRWQRTRDDLRELVARTLRDRSHGELSEMDADLLAAAAGAALDTAARWRDGDRPDAALDRCFAVLRPRLD